VAAALKPATLLAFHRAMKERKYRRLFSPQRRGKPGPKGPSKELVQAIGEIKRRNPRYGCPRICRRHRVMLHVQHGDRQNGCAETALSR